MSKLVRAAYLNGLEAGLRLAFDLFEVDGEGWRERYRLAAAVVEALEPWVEGEPRAPMPAGLPRAAAQAVARDALVGLTILRRDVLVGEVLRRAERKPQPEERP